MRYYIVVEGRCGESIVYPKWISYVNEQLVQKFCIDDIVDNSYYLISGNGFPRYYQVIDNAIEDINASGKFDCLVIAVDSEEFSYSEKYEDILTHVGARLVSAELKIIIQHPCMETWALGNRVVYRRNPEDEMLRKFLKFYNVRVLDPELLPDYPEKDLNRAQFAFLYLKHILVDRYPHLTYTKSNPNVLLHIKYFEQLKKRLIETKHINSFKVFLQTFSDVKT
jgi:hypothetical protein